VAGTTLTTIGFPPDDWPCTPPSRLPRSWYPSESPWGGSGWYFKNGAYNNGLPSGARTSVHFRNIELWQR
jgi:hypothetical protein